MSKVINFFTLLFGAKTRHFTVTHQYTNISCCLNIINEFPFRHSKAQTAIFPTIFLF